MRVIVVGAGKVGFNIAQILSREGHDVVLIEKDEERIQVVQEHLDIQTICGSGASCATLEEAGVREADMFVAVTESDELNLVACIMAKQYGVPKTIARARNPEYVESSRQISYAKVGIDLLINPERVTALEIVKLLENPQARDVEFYADGKIQLEELEIRDDLPLASRQINQLKNLGQFLIVAIIREGRLIIPGGDDYLRPRDRVYIIARTSEMPRLERHFACRQVRIEDVVILGGGRIGYYLAQQLERKNYNIKVIEKDHKKCKSLAARLKKTLVINGDAVDTDLLLEENIGQADAFIAVTGDDKLNLLVALMAKSLGAKRTVVQVRRSDLIPLLEHVDVDTVVSPRILTAGAILRFVRKGEVASVTVLEDSRAEVIELTVPASAPVVNRRLKEVKLPKGTLIGAIVRGGQAIIPGGDDQVNGGDRVLVFSIPENIPKVEHFFGAQGKGAAR
ncbi:Trk system potassium uptake protein TrkA [Thermacetogenium phaeum DSM 12270]|jgi:trk system potassium uptake protein TrkA|uniref:Trk system potassium uptake protein TrkA n=1 Tax=Thermacetogenium phaeum (strain ATCC BAA-254 / DSM 26808 / PB) TaxID=1089553 RepID=K4LM45_THEPS|nr:Trk system potassium transporter TrkA [Thermacetogenium phaeum]AFV13050.1 Trk system potassium uptake protein TrkA [Thermacetogenium phaeum DSM 12270]